MKSRDNVSGIGILGVLILLVLLPLVAVLFQIVCPSLQLENFDLSNLSMLMDVFVRPLWKKAFMNSFTLSLGTTVIGLILAIVLANIRVKYDFFGAKIIDLISWVLMIIPWKWQYDKRYQTFSASGSSSGSSWYYCWICCGLCSYIF